MISELIGLNPDAPDLTAAIARLQHALGTLCDERTAAVSFGKLCLTLQINTPPSEALSAYYEIMLEYPVYLVEHATRELIKHHRYPTFPKPADWLGYIEPPLADAKALLCRLIRAQRKVKLAHKMIGG